MNLKKIAVLWGVLDLCSFGWFVVNRVLRGEIPFYQDMIASAETGQILELPFLVAAFTLISLVLYISLIFSGVYLIKQKRAGAILSYIQAPCRLITLIPPSIFVILWPLKLFPVWNPPVLLVVAGIGLIAVSEVIKVWTVILWQKSEKPHNQSMNRTGDSVAVFE